ncbi:hypothetical protein Val02_74960 [Virgisporangium aliadipatigenens]|uniref:Uncharacterized protein n=1 Tax=Virgisporangium aliadipatigenens TaxID=741659 RepID=A0A8J3YVH5_9ACTN|nr:hypothetical protein Val02_74960 [Virgisporangium aliadipatigenens]
MFPKADDAFEVHHVRHLADDDRFRVVALDPKRRVKFPLAREEGDVPTSPAAPPRFRRTRPDLRHRLAGRPSAPSAADPDALIVWAVRGAALGPDDGPLGGAS